MELYINFKAVFAEFIATTLFVFVGTGTAMTFLTNNLVSSSWGVTVALSFGLGIASLISSVAHISGGHLNSAVSWGLFILGKVSFFQMLANTLAQCLGSILASGLLYGMLPNSSSSTLGANVLFPGVSVGNAVLGEIVMTYLLMFVILMTAVDKKLYYAPFAIGLAVFVGHSVLLPIDGCSINPTRSLGPAVISGNWDNFWVFIVGPYVGASLASMCYMILGWMREVEMLESSLPN
jgi:MIP family channel proteins